MLIAQRLSALALRQLLDGACRSLGLTGAAAATAAVANYLVQRFSDQSQRLPVALQAANDRAWRALEIGLAGDSFWDRCKRVLTSGEDKAFREQVQKLLEQTSFVNFAQQLTFRPACLNELHAARKGGLLDGGPFNPQALAEEVGAFARFADPMGIYEAECRAVERLAEDLRQARHTNLATLVALRPPQGLPLLVIAVRYFFRRAVEEDPKLFQGLAFGQMERLQHEQEEGFDSLHRLMTEQGERLFPILDEVRETVQATHATVLDIQEEQRRQGEQNRDIYETVLRLQNKFDLLHQELRPQHSFSIRNDGERQLVKELVARYRGLPEDRRGQLPALLNAIGKLEVAAGDFEAARTDFRAVAGMVGESKAAAEAHYNAYRAALEKRDWATALEELRAAVAGDPARFAPFPMDKFQPIRILGAGGFGVAFLCKHRYLNAEVVIKTLADAELDRDVTQVFAEAYLLRQVDHPAIIRLQDCGFADPTKEARPYLVMDFFEGATLEGHVQQNGPLAVDDLLAVAVPAAQGLQAAHARNILHRDIKPANLLVRRGADGWQAKLIDFGLALRREAVQSTMAAGRTLAGVSVAGTLNYAAPEQMGQLEGVSVGPAADVYGFGRTCCFALFQTPQPLLRHWRSVPPALAELLEACLEEQPRNRPQSLAELVQRLNDLRPGAAPTPAAAPLIPQPPVVAAPTPAPAFPAAPTTTVAAATSGLTLEQRRHELTVLANRVNACTRCTDLVRSRTRTVFGAGPLEAEICFLGEAPGADEDRAGEPFIGAAGQLLNRIIAACGLKREEVYIGNLLKCRPPGNRAPRPTECSNCREYLDRQLELVRPKFLCAMGSSAAQNLLGRVESIGRLRGQFFEYRGIPVICTYHPAYLLPGRSPEKKRDVWEDMKMLLRRMGKPVPAAGSRFVDS